jgi:dTDP-4-amino-4,6-dideoxygalactose transaminase
MGTFGAAAFFSSQWSKPYTTGLGGMLAVNEAELAERVRRLRDEQACTASPATAAQLAAQIIAYESLVFPSGVSAARRAYRWASRRNMVTGSTAPLEYSARPADYFKTMCEVQAAGGLFELQRAEAGIAHRRQVVAWYDEALQNAGWPISPRPAGAEVALIRYPVRVADKPAALAAAERALVELGDWFNRPLHSHLAPQEAFGYCTGMCPQADRAARDIVNLPTHSRITRGYAARAVRFLLEHCQPAN